MGAQLIKKKKGDAFTFDEYSWCRDTEQRALFLHASSAGTANSWFGTPCSWWMDF